MSEETEVRTPSQSRTVRAGWLGTLITALSLQKDSLVAIICGIFAIDCGLVGKIATGVLAVLAFVNSFFVQYFRTNTKGPVETKEQKLKRLARIARELEEDEEAGF